MRILVTGISGYVGSELVPRLLADGHELRGLSRDPGRLAVDPALPVVRGDAISGDGLDAALEGVDCAYFLIHSMEGAAAEFGDAERRAAENVVAAAQRAGVARVVYLGGLVPAGDGPLSRHLRSRLEVEETLLQGFAEAVALRASIVIGAHSRSFRFLVRLVERVPIMPLPAWRVHRTQPIDGRDVVALLAACATTPHARGGLSLDIGGPDVVTYAQMMERIRDALLLGRPRIDLPLTLTPVAARVAAAIAGEDVGLIEPLMESLESDLLPRDDRAAGLLGVRLRRFDAAVERALRDWESTEELAAR
jgi:uncharacterized protein YbjT (DUF2867 family)